MTREAALRDLLLRILAPRQLSSLIRSLPGLERVAQEVSNPKDTAPEDYIDQAVAELQRDGAIDERFFAALRERRPKRSAEIDAVAYRYLGTVPPVAPASASTAAVSGAAAKSTDTRAEPLLEPTMPQWCWQQRRPLALLSLVPITAAALAWTWARSRYGLDQQVNPATLAVQVGQGVLSFLAWLVFSGWTDPWNSSHLFKRSAPYERMQKLQEHALKGGHDARDVELRDALGVARDETTTEEWFKAAHEGNRQMSAIWHHLWGWWTLLYISIGVLSVLRQENLVGEAASLYLGTVPTLLNNAAAGSILIAFWIMTFVTVPIDGIGESGAVPRSSIWLKITVKISVFVLWVLHILLLAGSSSLAELKSWDNVAGLVSGILSAVIMAMHAGRFDSKFLGIRLRILLWLYLWAAIQPIWPVLDLLETVGGNPAELSWYEPAQVTLYSYAWFSKYLFFVLSAWLFHTGRLEFFLLRLRRLQASVAADWRRVTT